MTSTPTIPPPIPIRRPRAAGWIEEPASGTWPHPSRQAGGSGPRGGVPDAARPDLAGADDGPLLGLAGVG
jgi:hypothetical protein